MDPFSRLLNRAIAIGLGVAYLGTQCLFAYQPENKFWEERRRAAKRQDSLLVAALPTGKATTTNAFATPLPEVQPIGPSLSRSISKHVPKGFLKDHEALFSALSPGYGTIRKVSIPKNPLPNGPVVIHIQDVHRNKEAQWNIRQTVRLLFETGRIDLVGLEGSSEEIDLQPFVDFPFRRAVEASADFVLKENKITGPIHAAMTARGRLPRMVGIDDPVHYAANVQAYRDATPRMTEHRRGIDAELANMEKQKALICSPDFREFDDAIRGYGENQLPLGDYVLALLVRARWVPPHVRSFAQALAMERRMDIHQVERERTALIGELLKRLNTQETNTLLAQSLAYRSGQMGYADFYQTLKKMCEDKGVSLSQFHSLDAYVRYVLLSDGIDAERLFEELGELEKSIYGSLAKTHQERAWVDRCRLLRLQKKLVTFSLTSTDWKEYEASMGQSEFAPFEAFYREAQVRDGAMAENLLKALATDHGSAAVLVTGGYHAEGIVDRLTQRGVAVVSFVPRIGKIDTAQGAVYLSIFTQEKTPLEKLFAGEKLFLGPNPAEGVAETSVLTQSLGQLRIHSGIKDDLASLQNYLDRYHKGVNVSLEDPMRTRDGGWVAKVEVRRGEETVGYSLEADKDFNIKSFGAIDSERRPPFGLLIEICVPIHRWMGRMAGRISPWTERLPFSCIALWTPAHFLWLARRHKVRNKRDFSLLLVWMAVHVSTGSSSQGVWSIWKEILKSWQSSFDDHEFWIQRGLFDLAANKEGGTHASPPENHPSHPSSPHFKELKMLGPNHLKAGVNGQRAMVARWIFVRGNEYLLLIKRDKRTGVVKFDIPGGGAAGEDLGVSVDEGGQREVKEETDLKSKRYRRSVDLSLNKKGFRLFSIPGPKDRISARRATVFRRAKLDPHKEIRIHLSSEHKGHLWRTLPYVLNRFENLNTGPKMAFYLEFLREAFGITGVRSLASLSENHRIKTLSDPVLIETDKGWFLWAPGGEEGAILILTNLGRSLSLKSQIPLIAGDKSPLAQWPLPRHVREINGKEMNVPMGMWSLQSVGGLYPVGPFAMITQGEGGDGMSRRRAKINSLVDRIPRGAPVQPSIRLLVKKGDEYIFLKGNGHKNECLGGPEWERESIPANVVRQLGINRDSMEGVSVDVSETALFSHALSDENISKYVKVYDGVLQLDPSVPLHTDKLVVLTYEEIKNKYHEFTLSSRLLIVKEIIRREYGYTVHSIKPLRRSSEGDVLQIELSTSHGPFILRKANTLLDKPKLAIPILRKTDGSNGYYVNLGNSNFILVSRKTGKRKYEKLSQIVREQEAPAPRAAWTELFRGIAGEIKSSGIWNDLLEAQKDLHKTGTPVSVKLDQSPVTAWDYKLQLAFIDMIHRYFPFAHVVGEECPMTTEFLKSLTTNDQDRVIDLVFRNAANVPSGLVFFVDPIDGTRSFTEGKEEFAFTFGVLYNGKPLYAATYLPAKGILYEAVVKERAIYKNGSRIDPFPIRPFSLVKVQRGLKEKWEKADVKAFSQVNHMIPSIAVLAARMAAGEEGEASELVLNAEGVFSWDYVPAMIFFMTAGYKVKDFSGRSVLSQLRKQLRKGVSPRKLVSQILVAASASIECLRSTVTNVLRVPNPPDVNKSLATSLWMTKLFELFGSLIGGDSGRKRWGQHYKDNAFWYEWGLALAVFGINLVWVGSVWVGVGYGLLFLTSHFGARWLNLATQVTPGSIKPLVMALIYGTLVAASPFPLIDFFQHPSLGSWAIFELFFASWIAAFWLHWYMDRGIIDRSRSWLDRAREVNAFSMAYWLARWGGVEENMARRSGILGLLIEIPGLIWLRRLAEDPQAMGGGLFALMGYDPLWGPLLTVGMMAFAWVQFNLKSVVSEMEGNIPPSLRSFWGSLALLSFYVVPENVLLGMGVVAHVALVLKRLMVDSTFRKSKTISSLDVTNDGTTIRLLPSLPEGVKEEEEYRSVRFLVTRVVKGQVQYLLLKNRKGRWECPGGGVNADESTEEAVRREAEEELGSDVKKAIKSILIFGSHENWEYQFVHSIEKKEKTDYRLVTAGKVKIPASVRVKLNEESLEARWVTLDEFRDRYLLRCTVSTRMTFLNEILEKEYGIENIFSISPMNKMSEGGNGTPLLIRTENKAQFIFRSAGEDPLLAPVNVAVQQIFKISEGELIQRRGSEFSPDSFILHLGRHPMVLVKVEESGNIIERVDATQAQFEALGKIAGKISLFFTSPPYGHPLSKVPFVDLDFSNVKFTETSNRLTVNCIDSIDARRWVPRVELLIRIGSGTGDAIKLTAMVEAFESVAGPLTLKENQLFWGAMAAAHSRAGSAEESDGTSPSTLEWLLKRIPYQAGVLDNILRRAPWESVFLVVGMGLAVGAYLMHETSVGWVIGVPLLAGLLGSSHKWGTYGFVNGAIRVVNPPSLRKAISWFFWTGVFGSALLVIGAWVSPESLPWVLGGATWAGAVVGKKIHQFSNREWVVNHLDNGNLTPAQKDIARRILKNLEQKPITLGVEDIQAMVHHQAEEYSSQPGSCGIDSESPFGFLGNGVKFYFMDSVALTTPGVLEKTQNLMASDGDFYVVADQTIESLPVGRVILWGNLFKKKSGLFEVPLSSVPESFRRLMRDRPIQVLKTPLLALNADGLSVDDPLRTASKNAWVFVVELMRAFPADLFRWEDVWQVYRSLAESA